MTSIFIIGTGIVMWVLFGYSLSFAPSSNGIIGDLSWIGLEGVSLTEGYIDGAAIPNMVFCGFQMMFAIITPALITGAVAGRMKFKSLFVFIILWSLIVYYPLAHMVWADGGLLGLDGIGALDLPAVMLFTSVRVYQLLSFALSSANATITNTLTTESTIFLQ